MKFLLPTFLFLSACGMPLSEDKIAELVKGLATDNASACIEVVGGYGGATIPVVPVPIPTGAGGYGRVTACRSNQPGSEITASGISIKHGIYKQDKEPKALKEKLPAPLGP